MHFSRIGFELESIDRSAEIGCLESVISKSSQPISAVVKCLEISHASEY